MQKLKTHVAQTHSDQLVFHSMLIVICPGVVDRAGLSSRSLNILLNPSPKKPAHNNEATSETKPDQSDQSGQSPVVPSFLIICTCPPATRTAAEKNVYSYWPRAWYWSIQLFHSENRREPVGEPPPLHPLHASTVSTPRWQQTGSL